MPNQTFIQSSSICQIDLTGGLDLRKVKRDLQAGQKVCSINLLLMPTNSRFVSNAGILKVRGQK